MTPEYVAEFCLFIACHKITKNPTPQFLVEVVNRISACFRRASYPNGLNPNTIEAGLVVESCCATKDVYEPHTHVIHVRIAANVLHNYAAGCLQSLATRSEAYSQPLKDLSCGQIAWLAELALRSLVLNEVEFKALLRLCELDKECDAIESVNPTLLTLRQFGFVTDVVLCHDKLKRRELWTRNYGSFHLFLDTNSLRDYFGDSIGFYFAWMQSYTMLLILPMLCGLLCFLITVLMRFISSADPNTESYVQSVTLFALRGGFSFVMILWALICTKLWTRHHASFVEAWSTNSMLEQISNDFTWLFRKFDQRLDYIGEWRRSSVTGEMEHHFPTYKRRLRYAGSACVIVCCLIVASTVHVILLNLEGYITEERSPMLFIPLIGKHSSEGASFDPNQPGLLPYLPGVMHSLLVFVMNQLLFYHIAYALTKWENHRTQEKFDKALVIKRFLFESMDAYGCLAYLGFVLSDCDAVQSLLMTMLITDCIRRFLLECAIPFAIYHMRLWLIRRFVGKQKRMEDDDKTAGGFNGPHSVLRRELCADPYEPFDDYLEMTLQHGYLVLFAHIAPFCGALIALISVVLECHSDAIKMLWVTRRPTPRLLLRGHFIWLDLLAAQAWLSILTNVGLFVVSLQHMGVQLDISFSLLFLLLEHMFILIGVCIHVFVKNAPVHVRHARLAREFKRARLPTQTVFT